MLLSGVERRLSMLRTSRAARWPLLPYAFLLLWYLAMALQVIKPGALLHPSRVRWHGWWDQSLYDRSALAFGHLDLSPVEHYYPFLYSLIAAPFGLLWPGMAFFIPNLTCFLLAFEGFRRVARELSISAGAAALLFGFGTLLLGWQAAQWIIPWSTTLSAALLWLALGLLAEFRISRHPRQAAPFGALIMAIPFTRPGDAPAAALIGLGGLACMAVRRDGRTVRWAVVGGSATLAALGGLYLAIYGVQATSYMRLSAAYGYDFAVFGWRAEMLLSSPRAWFDGGTGLIEALPWLPIGAAGMLWLAWMGVAERRILPIVLAASTTLYLVLMLAYNDMLPPSLWRFNNVHYFKWLFPAYALAAALLLRRAVHRPAVLLALVPILALSAVRTVPVPAAPETPARMLLFAAPAGAEENPLYFAASLVTDRRGLQHNIFDYRQVRTGAIVRMFALQHRFAGDERWIGNGANDPNWPRVDHAQDNNVVLAGPWPRRPYARFTSRVAVGYPYWLPFARWLS
jgi:hypothetical protein